MFGYLKCSCSADARGRAGDNVCVASGRGVSVVLQVAPVFLDRTEMGWLNVAARYLDTLRIDPVIVLGEQ